MIFVNIPEFGELVWAHDEGEPRGESGRHVRGKWPWIRPPGHEFGFGKRSAYICIYIYTCVCMYSFD